MSEKLQELQEHTKQAGLGIVHPVGSESIAVITRLNPTESNPEHVGNVLRRTCSALGEQACQKTCALREAAEYVRSSKDQCADYNLKEGLEALGIDPKDVLMVGVTANEVGFGDELDSYREAGTLKDNPDGWQELPGFNAFFARAEEVPAIGSRLADCAHFEFEFKDRDGKTVIGFEHGTRPNMAGSGAYKFEVDGEPASYTHHVLDQAIRHYGADPESFQIRLSSSIRPENFIKHFDSEEKMEGHIPGWYESGFATNASNPEWKPGDLMNPEDDWYADARGMILHDIDEAMEQLGIPKEQFIAEDMLDPADTDGEYSSFQNKGTHGDYRDLYLIAHKSAYKGTQ